MNRKIEAIYYGYYIYFSRKTNDKSLDPGINYLQEQYSNPLIRYQSLAWTLSYYLDGLDIYARYPVKELQYNNIKFLNSPENKKSCFLLLEMIIDLVEVVPLVWDKISQL